MRLRREASPKEWNGGAAGAPGRPQILATVSLRPLLGRYRSAQHARVARIDARARALVARRRDAKRRAMEHPHEAGAWREAMATHFLRIYRTEADPRYVLKRQLERAAALGYTFYVGPELEYYYFKNDQGTELLDRASVRSLDFLNEIRPHHHAIVGDRGNGRPQLQRRDRDLLTNRNGTNRCLGPLGGRLRSEARPKGLPRRDLLPRRREGRAPLRPASSSAAAAVYAESASVKVQPLQTAWRRGA